MFSLFLVLDFSIVCLVFFGVFFFFAIALYFKGMKLYLCFFSVQLADLNLKEPAHSSESPFSHRVPKQSDDVLDRRS